MERSLRYSSMQFLQESGLIYHKDDYSEDYDQNFVPDGNMPLDQSEFEIDDDDFQKNREEKRKITSPIRKTALSRRARKTKAKLSKPIARNWTDEEHKKFLAFYREGHGGFTWTSSSGSKKRKGIFLEMSKYIGTRDPNQCKSHEQKFRSKLPQASNSQTPFDFDFDSNPDSSTLERSNFNHEMDYYSSEKVDGSPISTTLTDQSPGMDFHDVDIYLNFEAQAPAPYFEEDKKNFLKITSFSEETQEIESLKNLETPQEKTWTNLNQEGSNEIFRREIRSKMLDLVRDVSID